MTAEFLPRQTIHQTLLTALEPLQYTHAMWEGGAAAFYRVDEWSDIDLVIAVDDESVNEIFEVIESTLSSAASKTSSSCATPTSSWASTPPPSRDND